MIYCQSIISDQFLFNMVCDAINDNVLNIFIWFSFKKIHLKMSSTKCWQFCSGFNVLPHWGRVTHICSKPDHHRFREYRQISNISCTKSQNLNVSHLACSCLCPIHWSQVLSQEWRCSWSSTGRRCSNYIWVFNKLIAYSGAAYIKDLTVYFCLFNVGHCLNQWWHIVN